MGKYALGAEVGRGGMAVVYRGHDPTLRRDVAIKVLHPHLADREESRLRLQREALAVATLRHENILEIYDYSGERSDESYIVMEFVRGRTLREWMDSEAFVAHPLFAALIVHKLCEALGHAHDHGVIHRDIKPENVMVRTDDGCLKLMDFGIAQVLDNEKLTMTGQLIGSPAYMAPELMRGEPLDIRSDLFSLGILLYQLATGALPFSGRNPHEVLSKIMEGAYPMPSQVGPLVDRDLERIIVRALAQDKDARPASASAFAEALHAYVADAGLDPARASVDLRTYFLDAPAAIARTNELATQALVEASLLARKQAHLGRALNLVSRALLLVPGHREAKAALKLLLRHKRRRKVAAAAGLLTISLGAAFAVTQASLAAWARLGPKPDALQPSLATLAEVARGVRLSTASEPRTKSTSPVATPAPTSSAPRPGVRAPPPVRCRIHVEGVPVPTWERLLPLRFDGAAVRPRTSTFEVQLRNERALFMMNKNGWTASATILREDCLAGRTTTVVALAKARVRFAGLPTETSWQCIKGCSDRFKHLVNPDRPLVVAFERGASRHTISLRFWSEGYASQSLTEELYPGDQTIQVTLVPHGAR